MKRLAGLGTGLGTLGDSLDYIVLDGPDLRLIDSSRPVICLDDRRNMLVEQLLQDYLTETQPIVSDGSRDPSARFADKGRLHKVVDVRYVTSRIENPGRNMLSQDECAALIRVVNVAHLLALIQK